MQKNIIDSNQLNYNLFYHDLYNDLFYRDIIFPNKLNGYFVEIGAVDGILTSQSFLFEKTLNWNGIVVEPNPFWKKSLFSNRKCNISVNAISNKNENAIFECREIHQFSGLKNSVNQARFSDIINEIEIETITLYDLLNNFNSPKEIDWISIDTEGAELHILNKFFEQNDKYKINLLTFESHQYSDVVELFKNEPYLKIKNPYLDFIKISNYGLIKFDPFTGNFFKNSVKEWICDCNLLNDDIQNVEFEHYYIHIDYLKEHSNLKKLLL